MGFVGAPPYRIFFNAVGDAGDDVLDHSSVISVRLVVSESHNPPTGMCGIPMNLNYTIIELFP